MSARPVDELVEVLKGGRDALSPTVHAELEAAGEEGVRALIAVAGSEALLVAPDPEGWAPIHAVRMLATLRAYGAIPALLRILDGAEDDDLLSAEAAKALQSFGLASLSSIARFIERTTNPQGRGLALEVAANLRGEYDGPEAFDEVRVAVERTLSASDDASLRIALIEYLGDLGSEESIDALAVALSRPTLTYLEYDAIRDVLERLAAVCPDLYFDASGKGYPLDDEKIPHCPACDVRMIFGESGDLIHPAPACEGNARPSAHSG